MKHTTLRAIDAHYPATSFPLKHCQSHLRPYVYRTAYKQLHGHIFMDKYVPDKISDIPTERIPTSQEKETTIRTETKSRLWKHMIKTVFFKGSFYLAPLCLIIFMSTNLM